MSLLQRYIGQLIRKLFADRVHAAWPDPRVHRRSDRLACIQQGQREPCADSRGQQGHRGGSRGWPPARPECLARGTMGGCEGTGVSHLLSVRRSAWISLDDEELEFCNSKRVVCDNVDRDHMDLVAQKRVRRRILRPRRIWPDSGLPQSRHLSHSGSMYVSKYIGPL